MLNVKNNELNLSETVFLQKSSVKNADYKVCIFTPKAELPFAGHPTIASAFAYKNFYNSNKNRLIQDCQVGLITIDKQNEIYFVNQKDPQFFDSSCTKENAADMLGIKTEAIADYPIIKISTGIYWGIIMLNSSNAVSQVKPNHEKIIAFCQKENLVGIQVFAKNNDGRSDIHMRTFAPLVGVYEDPSCGSGNGCIASYIAKYNILNKTNYIVSQGAELGRESTIYASFAKDGDTINKIRIGGSAVKVLEGGIEI